MHAVACATGVVHRQMADFQFAHGCWRVCAALTPALSRKREREAVAPCGRVSRTEGAWRAKREPGALRGSLSRREGEGAWRAVRRLSHVAGVHRETSNLGSPSPTQWE